MKYFKFYPTTSIIISSIIPTVSNAAVIYDTWAAKYSQNFNTLGSTTTTSTAWANDTTLTGWNLFRQPTPGTALTTYGIDTGSSTSGSFFSYGTSGNSDRALGGLGSGGSYYGSPSNGSIAGWIAVQFTNSTGVTLDSFTVGFDGEQWRDGGAATPTAQSMVMEYGYGATFATVATWTQPGGNFNWTSPVVANTGSGAVVNGNVAGLSSGRGGIVSNTIWAPGTSLWIRWVERNDAGNDHALAIDNFTFLAPEPVSLGSLGLIGYTALRRRKH